MPKQAPINTITVKIWEDKGSIDLKQIPQAFSSWQQRSSCRSFLIFIYTAGAGTACS